jgi:hypothetical protein
MISPVAAGSVEAMTTGHALPSRAKQRRSRRERRLLMAAGAAALIGLLLAAVLVLGPGSPGQRSGTTGTIGLSMAGTNR